MIQEATFPLPFPLNLYGANPTSTLNESIDIHGVNRHTAGLWLLLISLTKSRYFFTLGKLSSRTVYLYTCLCFYCRLCMILLMLLVSPVNLYGARHQRYRVSRFWHCNFLPLSHSPSAFRLMHQTGNITDTITCIFINSFHLLLLQVWKENSLVQYSYTVFV